MLLSLKVCPSLSLCLLSRKMEEEIEGGRLMIGKFLEDVDADQVLWGNVFEHPIRDNLPWGTAIATKFM
jgi:hypothetical protein